MNGVWEEMAAHDFDDDGTTDLWELRRITNPGSDYILQHPRLKTATGYWASRQPKEKILERADNITEESVYAGNLESELELDQDYESEATPISAPGARLTDENYPIGTWRRIWVQTAIPRSVPTSETWLVFSRKIPDEAAPVEAPVMATVTFIIPAGELKSSQVVVQGDITGLFPSGGSLNLNPPKGYEMFLQRGFEYVEIMPDGELRRHDEGIPLSDPAPEVNVSRFSVQGAGAANGQLSVNISVAGTLDDAQADMIPHEDEGIVNRLYLIVNDDERIPIPINHAKVEKETRYRKYDYTGTFDQVVPVTGVTEGLNTVRLLAVGPTGNEGYSLHTFEIIAQPNGGSGNVAVTAIDLEDGLTETDADSITVTDALGTRNADETGIDTGRFTWTDSAGLTHEIELDQEEIDAFSATEIDLLTAVVRPGTGAASIPTTLLLRETAENSRLFTQQEAAASFSSFSYQTGETRFVEKSDPGPFHPR